MSRISTSEESNSKDNVHITYYFTVLFTVIGTVLVFCFMYQIIAKFNLFIVFLSTCGGGIPIGFIGIFIDYKVSKYRLAKRNFGQ